MFRTYGRAPFRLALVHGGPSAPGEMAPLARDLAPYVGVLEPLQTADSVEGQIGACNRLNVLDLQGKAGLPETFPRLGQGALALPFDSETSLETPFPSGYQGHLIDYTP